MEQGLFVSGHGGSTRANKPVPRSAVVHGSVKYVPSSERHKSRKSQTASAMTQRVPVSPPVCGVQPGKVLQLRTTLGIMRARALLDQTLQHPPPTQPQAFPAESTGAESVQRAGNTKGQLKTGRLQPLGIVDDPALTTDDCLGVVPVSPSREGRKKQRPRSSTAPGVQFDLSDGDAQDGRAMERVGRKVKVKQRSYSAVLARSLDSTQLIHLLSVSKQTALVPEKNAGTAEPREGSSLGSSEETGGGRIQFLPPVVTQGELGLKVEVKGLTKMITTDSSAQEVTPAQAHLLTGSDGQGLPRAPKLPPLVMPQTSPFSSSSSQKSPSRRRDSNSKTGKSSDREHGMVSLENDEKEGGGGRSDEETSPRKVSIVSLGEAAAADNGSKLKTSRRKRNSSGRSSGRLSLGWITPQPITEPLKGSSLPPPGTEFRTPVGKKAPAVNRQITGVQYEQNDMIKPERAVSPNMLSVNVSQVLIEAEQADDT